MQFSFSINPQFFLSLHTDFTNSHLKDKADCILEFLCSCCCVLGRHGCPHGPRCGLWCRATLVECLWHHVGFITSPLLSGLAFLGFMVEFLPANVPITIQVCTKSVEFREKQCMDIPKWPRQRSYLLICRLLSLAVHKQWSILGLKVVSIILDEMLTL